jgi:SSS family solute:Na+ symporter
MALSQLLFVMFIVPLFVPVILGMLWKRTTTAAAFLGLLSGILGCLAMFLYVHWFPGEAEGYRNWYPETYAQLGSWNIEKFNPRHLLYLTFSENTKDIPANVWMAVWTFIITFTVVVGVSLVTEPKPVSELKNLCFGETDIPSQANVPLLKKPVVWGGVLLAICILLNIIFW